MADWHFQFNIDTDPLNLIVYVKIYGVWREDTARTYHEEFIKEVAEMLDKPWARLVDLSNWRTASDEVIEIIGQHMLWCKDNNCKASAYVIDNPITYGQLMRMIEKGQVKEMTKTFRTRSEAEKFLKEQGFPIKSQPDEREIFK